MNSCVFIIGTISTIFVFPYYRYARRARVCIRAKWLVRPELIPVSVAWSDWWYFYSPLDGMLVHHRVTPQLYIRRYPFIHLGGERECENILSENTTQCPRPGLEPGPFDPETRTLTVRPPRLHYYDKEARRNKQKCYSVNWRVHTVLVHILVCATNCFSAILTIIRKPILNANSSIIH